MPAAGSLNLTRDEIDLKNMLAMRKAFTALANNTDGQGGSLLDTQTSSLSSVAHMLMANGSYDNAESESSTYLQGRTDNESSPESPHARMHVPSSIDRLSNLSDKQFKEETGDSRVENDTKEGSMTSGKDHQDLLSTGGNDPALIVPREKKRLKPTSSCYYYQQNSAATGNAVVPRKEEIPFDKKSLNLERPSKPQFVVDDSTQSVKNYNIGHSKRKNTETMHSPQIECLSGGASEFSNLNFPKLETNMGIDSPISSRSIELVKTKSNRDKNEKKLWRNADTDKIPSKQAEDKQKTEFYRNDGQRKYINSPKHQHAKKKYQNGGVHGSNNGNPKHGTSSGAGSLYQSGGLTEDNFPKIEDVPDTKVKNKKSEHIDRQEKLPLGMPEPSGNRRRRGGDRKGKK